MKCKKCNSFRFIGLFLVFYSCSRERIKDDVYFPRNLFQPPTFRTLYIKYYLTYTCARDLPLWTLLDQDIWPPFTSDSEEI